jgi:hypothetical protein
MTELTITLTGEIRESNFEEWKSGLAERIQAVDTTLAENDDFTSANDSIRQFRDAELTLKNAKQAALQQAADINRLFDAVDAATEETRQARLSLERKVRVRRQEIKQQAMQAHFDTNAATLDALTPAEQALFQDRTTLLSLSFEELENTIAERIGVWQAAQSAADSPQTASCEINDNSERTVVTDGRVNSEQAVYTQNPSDDQTDTEANDVSRGWRVTIDLSAPRAEADQIFTRVRDRWKADRAVDGIDLIAKD